MQDRARAGGVADRIGDQRRVGVHRSSARSTARGRARCGRRSLPRCAGERDRVQGQLDRELLVAPAAAAPGAGRRGREHAEHEDDQHAAHTEPTRLDEHDALADASGRRFAAPRRRSSRRSTRAGAAARDASGCRSGAGTRRACRPRRQTARPRAGGKDLLRQRLAESGGVDGTCRPTGRRGGRHVDRDHGVGHDHAELARGLADDRGRADARQRPRRAPRTRVCSFVRSFASLSSVNDACTANTWNATSTNIEAARQRRDGDDHEARTTPPAEDRRDTRARRADAAASTRVDRGAASGAPSGPGAGADARGERSAIRDPGTGVMIRRRVHASRSTARPRADGRSRPAGWRPPRLHAAAAASG